jgi:ketosteroid isomerase-like protein
MPPLTHGDAQDLLARLKRGWEGRDPDALMELFRDDAEYREDPFAEPLTGGNAIRARWNDIVASQVHIEFQDERTWVSGRTILTSWHGAHTRRSTGERVRQRGFMTLELDDDGLIARLRHWPAERVVGTDSTIPIEGEDAHGR